MSDDSRVTVLESLIEDRNLEITKLKNKLFQIEVLLTEKVYCEYIRDSVNKKIFEIINEK